MTTLMLAPTSPVPAMTGLVTLVMPSPRIPLSLAVSNLATGGAGGVVSIPSTTEVTAETFPATSVSVTLASPVVPSGSGWVGVTDQVPSAATVVVNTSPVPGMTTLMLAPASPLPEIVGVASLVFPSPA